MKRKNVSLSRALRKSQTDAEKKLWSILRNRQLDGVKFRRQFTLGSFILDIYSPEHKLCIEADGGGHYEESVKKSDESRKVELQKLGVKVLRVSNEDILKNIDGVCELILKELKNPLTSILSPKGRGGKYGKVL